MSNDNTGLPVLWITLTKASQLLGYKSNGPVRRMIRRNLIQARLIPGTHPRVNAADIYRLAEFITPVSPEHLTSN